MTTKTLADRRRGTILEIASAGYVNHRGEIQWKEALAAQPDWVKRLKINKSQASGGMQAIYGLANIMKKRGELNVTNGAAGVNGHGPAIVAGGEEQDKVPRALRLKKLRQKRYYQETKRRKAQEQANVNGNGNGHGEHEEARPVTLSAGVERQKIKHCPGCGADLRLLMGAADLLQQLMEKGMTEGEVAETLDQLTMLKKFRSVLSR